MYGVQLALNGVWTPVFFGLKRIDFALGIILVLFAAIAETTRRFSRVDRPATLLMLPYLLWVAFALLLSSCRSVRLAQMRELGGPGHRSRSSRRRSSR